jgi:hypothetical protein
MARVQGVKEKLHSPIYDAFFVDSGKTFLKEMGDPRMLRFFVDVQHKTKLETNLQASGQLPSLNTFEARAMRVVASARDLPRCLELNSNIKEAFNELNTEAEKCISWTGPASEKFCDALHKLCAFVPTLDASTVLSELIYNSVTTLLVGEKIMIETPTFYFPAGAGVSPGNGVVSNHGNPDPMATFRFAEPVRIDSSQAFRVEMLFPRRVPKPLEELIGPFRIWVLLDGYLTRDVQ